MSTSNPSSPPSGDQTMPSSSAGDVKSGRAAAGVHPEQPTNQEFLVKPEESASEQVITNPESTVKLEKAPSVPETMDQVLASTAIQSLSLASHRLGDWILLQKTVPDIYLDNEPYVGNQLLVQPGSRKYLHRVWGRTKLAGDWMTYADLINLCQLVFGYQSCLGITENHPAYVEISECQAGFFTNYPVNRFIAYDCLMTYSAKTSGKTTNMCSACQGAFIDFVLEDSSVDSRTVRG